ncbi:MAG: hypothetical protein VB124_03480 [Burkholderia sp.]
MSLRFLPLGINLYLVGGILFGFGVGFGVSVVPGFGAVLCTGLGSLMIVAGYYVMRPLSRAAKAEIRALASNKAKTEATAQ